MPEKERGIENLMSASATRAAASAGQTGEVAVSGVKREDRRSNAQPWRCRVLRTLAAGATLVLLSNAAAWSATLRIQVRSDYLPGVDFSSARAYVYKTDEVSLRRIAEVAADPLDPYLTGAVVADFQGIPDGDYAGWAELLDATGSAIVRRPLLVTGVTGNRVVTVLLTMSVGPPDDHDFWTYWISEEDGPATCRAGSAARGIECANNSCDDLRLLCNPIPGGLGAERWTAWFSDEDPDLQGCDPDELATGIDCDGAFCDDISLRCHKIAGETESCFESIKVTDGDPPLTDSDGFYIRRMECTGNNCDDKRLEMCRMTSQLWAMWLRPSQCVSVEGSPGNDILPGSQLLIAPCRAADDDNEDQQWQLGCDGRISHRESGQCATSQADTILTVDCDDDPTLWFRDQLNLIHSEDDPAVCIEIPHLGEPGEPPEEGTPLGLTPCTEGEGHRWDISDSPAGPLFCDGFESGDSVNWSSSPP